MINNTVIEWTDKTANPVVGCPLPHCNYCYAKKIYRRFTNLGNKNFTPKFYQKRLKDFDKELDRIKPCKIFVCSVADLFCEESMKKGWFDKVMAVLKKHPQHTYQLLTKRPQNIPADYDFGKNVWVGATVNCQEEIWKIDMIAQVKCGVRFVSFEPLLGEIKPVLRKIDWVIIGKLTGSRKIPLNNDWVSILLNIAGYDNIPVFVKNNIGWKEKIQNFPRVTD